MQRQRMTGRSFLFSPQWLAVMVVLLATALRFAGLASQGLWDDEGISYGRTILPLGQMLAHLPAEQMPLYYVLLHLWIKVLGHSVWAMRALSALPAIAMVPLVFYWGRRCLGSWVGLTAALLLALAPASIYQAQTMRGYPWLGASLLSAAAATEWIVREKRWVAAPVYWLSASVALLTHLLGALSILVLNVWVLGKHRRDRRWLSRWLFLQVCVAVGPLLWLAWSLSGAVRGEMLSTAGGNLPGLLGVMRDFAAVLVAAPYDPTTLAQALAGLPLLLLAAWGLAAPGPRYRLLVAGLALLPLPLMYGLAMVGDVPLYPYYWVYVAPWTYLGAALGLVRLAARWRWAGALALVLVVVLLGWNTSRYFRRTVEDLAPLAARIAQDAQPGDAVVLSSVWRAECFKYYDHTGLPAYAEPNTDDVRDIASQHARVWLVVFGRHPTPPIVEGIVRPGFEVGRWSSGTTELSLYLRGTVPREISRPLRTSFGDRIELLGYDLQPETVLDGSVAQLTLWWRASSPVDVPYKVFAHLVGPDGNIWAQHDGEPADGTQPTTSWNPGEVVVDRHALRVLPGTLPGAYRLLLGLYDGSTGQRLPVQGDGVPSQDNALVLGELSVESNPKPEPDRLELQHSLGLTLPGGLTLLGYDLHKLGREQSNVRFKRGDFIHVNLYWLTPSQSPDLHTILLELVDRQGIVQSQLVSGAEDLLAPGPVWPPHALVTRQHNLSIPEQITLGEYDLFLTLRDSTGQELIPRRQLGPITVYPNVTPTPAP